MCGNMSMGVTPYVYLPVLFSAATCKYRYNINQALPSKISFLPSIIYHGGTLLFAPTNLILVIELIIMSANLLLNIS